MSVPNWKNVDGKVVVEQEFVGATISDEENNGYHDSDFFAVVWDEEQGCIRSFQYGTTRAYAPTSCTPDITDENKQKAMDWNFHYLFEYHINMQWNNWCKECRTICVGDEVQFVKKYRPRKGEFAGKTFEQGERAEIGWVGVDQFQSNHRRTVAMYRVQTEDGSQIFRNEYQVEKVVDAEFYPNVEWAREYAEYNKKYLRAVWNHRVAKEIKAKYGVL